jgi:hypothetical protein
MGYASYRCEQRNRVTPWAPPRELMEREWVSSEGRAALNASAPPHHQDRSGRDKRASHQGHAQRGQYSQLIGQASAQHGHSD